MDRSILARRFQRVEGPTENRNEGIAALIALGVGFIAVNRFSKMKRGARGAEAGVIWAKLQMGRG
jgi:hypothetical protein